MHPTPIDKAFYGKFFSGDAYIVLHTKQEKPGRFTFDLFFWLGQECSVDEQGTAAILAAQLDDKLGGQPVQYRITQGSEPPEFTKAMGGALEYMEGGCGSRFYHVVPEVIPTRLLHVKGLKEVRIQQVKRAASTLNSGDVFILDTGKVVFQWIGKEASHKERAKATEVCIGIKNERLHRVEELGQEVELVYVREGDGGADEDRFWNELGGDRSEVGQAKPDTDKDDAKAAAGTSLWNLQELSSGEMKFTEIKKRPLDRSMLDENDSFILACPTEIFVWIGSRASKAERSNAMVYAQRFLNGEDGKKRPKWTPVQRVTQGAEPTAFTSKFKVWEQFKPASMDDVVAMLARKGLTSGKNIAKKIEQPTSTEIVATMTISKTEMKQRAEAKKKPPEKLLKASDGKLEVWRVNCFKKHPVPPALHGQFFAGDSYIVMFTYIDDRNKEKIRLYFWLGRLCSADERGSAALLTRELDEEKGGSAVQVRVVQNNEPDDFLALFGGKLVVHDGGLSKEGNDTQDHDGIGLFQVKAFDEDTVRTVQVVESATSLNSADCFVLQTPGLLHVWLGSLASDVEKRTGQAVGHAMAARLKYAAEHNPTMQMAEVLAAQAAEKAAVEAAKVDEDGDGVPDVARSLVLMVDADGDGISDGLHADKLGLFMPQPDSINDRPYYANDDNRNLLMWWSGGKWWLGKADELGRNRGWLKVESRNVVPPREGWAVYSKKEKNWEPMVGMVAIPAERIAMSGTTTDEKLNDKLAGEWVRCAELHEGRPVYVREGRSQLMLWWNSGRWWLGKRAEKGTNRGWLKAVTDASSPCASGISWTFYSADEKKWVSGDGLAFKLIRDKAEEPVLPEPPVLPPPVPPSVSAEPPASWNVEPCHEGLEPPSFWKGLGGKQPYETTKPAKASGEFEPRFFECSNSTGVFRVEEVFDVCQEDLEHEDVYLVDCWSEVFLWVGRNCREAERSLGMEVAREYVSAQAALDGRPAAVQPLLIIDGEEPKAFTVHFVGWSSKHAESYEDPYEKRRKVLERQEDEKLQEAKQAHAENIAETMATSPDRSSLLKEIIKKTQERADRHGGAPPVAAFGTGDMFVPSTPRALLEPASPRVTPFKHVVKDLGTLKRSNSFGLPSMHKLGEPLVPKLSLASVASASSLDSARRRANAAMVADNSLSGDGAVKYLDPQEHRFTMEEIKTFMSTEEIGGRAQINPLCTELYLLDSEFMKVFGMDKDAFWKQPQWKQRDAKKKSGLF